MAATKNTLTLRRQEHEALLGKQQRLRLRIAELFSILSGNLVSCMAEWDARADEYRAALKSLQDCEDQLKGYKPWTDLDYRERQKRKKK